LRRHGKVFSKFIWLSRIRTVSVTFH